MKLSEFYNGDRTVLSFEVFPPKKTGSVETVYNTIAELQSLKPDYISVTYGAGGSAANNYTCDIASLIKNKFNIEAMAHLTCVNSTKEDVDKVLNELKENNIFQSMSRKGNCYDNSVMENFFGLLKQEMYYGITYYSFKELKATIEKYIKYYNEKRIKQKLGWMSPVEYRLNLLAA